MSEDLKVGVFICECGGNISDTVDIQKVKDSLNVEEKSLGMQFLFFFWTVL